MHSFKMVPLGAIATLLLGAVVVNDATGNEPATEVMVCNSTDTDVLVAASYRPVGEDRYLRRGWFRVGASSCETLFETRGRYVYLYAERDGQSGYWGGERNLCVDYTAPFRFYSSESNTCTRQQETVPFQEFELSEGQRNLPWILH